MVVTGLHLSAEESALLQLSDNNIEILLNSAQQRDETSREQLLAWAYIMAYRYYTQKMPMESQLAATDVEDLTGAFLVEFENNLPRLQNAVRFTRFLLKQNLKRHLRRKKWQQLKLAAFAGRQRKSSSDNQPFIASGKPWQDWDDTQFTQYQAVLEIMKDSDLITQQILQYRLENPPKQFNEIATALGISETAARMRTARFYAAVRKKYQKIVLRNM